MDYQNDKAFVLPRKNRNIELFILFSCPRMLKPDYLLFCHFFLLLMWRNNRDEYYLEILMREILNTKQTSKKRKWFMSFNGCVCLQGPAVLPVELLGLFAVWWWCVWLLEDPVWVVEVEPEWVLLVLPLLLPLPISLAEIWLLPEAPRLLEKACEKQSITSVSVSCPKCPLAAIDSQANIFFKFLLPEVFAANAEDVKVVDASTVSTVAATTTMARIVNFLLVVVYMYSS